MTYLYFFIYFLFITLSKYIEIICFARRLQKNVNERGVGWESDVYLLKLSRFFNKHCVTKYISHRSTTQWRCIHYDLPFPSSYNKVSAWVADFFAFSYALLLFPPGSNRRDTSVSIDYRTRNGDYASVMIDQSYAGCIGRVRSLQ